MNVLHIYGQEAFHDEVYIVGNKSELIKLRNMIDRGIVDDYESDEFYINDGEGYTVMVFKIEDGEVDKIAVPYFVDYAKEKRPDAIYPWQL